MICPVELQLFSLPTWKSAILNQPSKFMSGTPGGLHTSLFSGFSFELFITTFWVPLLANELKKQLWNGFMYMFMNHDINLKKNPLIDPKKNKSEFEGLCGFYIVAKTKFLPSNTTHYF